MGGWLSREGLTEQTKAQPDVIGGSVSIFISDYYCVQISGVEFVCSASGGIGRELDCLSALLVSLFAL